MLIIIIIAADIARAIIKMPSNGLRQILYLMWARSFVIFFKIRRQPRS